MAALGRFQESADAYEHLAKLVPNDPQILADWADALGMAQGRTLRGRPRELAMKALEADPNHQKALALAATAAMDAGEFAASLGYWQRIAVQLPPGSEDAAKLESILAEVRGRAAAAGKPVAAPTAVAKAPAAAAQPKSVSGSVALDSALTAKVTGGETLFVFARAEGGPRMPLAILRSSAKQLPLQFALDDTMAMSPASTISSAAAVRIEARISRSGNATPQPGDLVGVSEVVKPGARGVKIVVDRVLP
jgi:cytochrome c-type biogenesis protein CcmH